MARSEAFARGARAAGALEVMGWKYDGEMWSAPLGHTRDELRADLVKAERQLEDLRRCGKNMTRFFEQHTDPDGGGTNMCLTGAEATALLARIVDGEVLLREERGGGFVIKEWDRKVDAYLDRPKGERVLDEDIDWSSVR